MQEVNGIHLRHKWQFDNKDTVDWRYVIDYDTQPHLKP